MNYDWIEMSDKTLFRKRTSFELSGVNKISLLSCVGPEKTPEYKEYLKEYNKKVKTYNTVSEMLFEVPLKMYLILVATYILLIFIRLLFGVISEKTMVMIVAFEGLVILTTIVIGYLIMQFYKYPVDNFSGEKYK